MKKETGAQQRTRLNRLKQDLSDMVIKVGINGFGRIGRLSFRGIWDRCAMLARRMLAPRFRFFLLATPVFFQARPRCNLQWQMHLVVLHLAQMRWNTACCVHATFRSDG